MFSEGPLQWFLEVQNKRHLIDTLFAVSNAPIGCGQKSVWGCGEGDFPVLFRLQERSPFLGGFLVSSTLSHKRSSFWPMFSR